jgi:hypothetical protein
VSYVPSPPSARLSPAIVVHSLAEACQALSLGLPTTLLSAPAAALFAGCGWWRALTERARQKHPTVLVTDILDCADAPGQAMAALRIGQRLLVLSPSAPGWEAVAAIAATQGGAVLTARPPALDLASRGAIRRLHAWLHIDPTQDDRAKPLG